MTREQAKQKVKIEKREFYPYSIDDNVDEVIDEIYDDFERELLKAQKKSYIDGSNVWTWKKKENK